MMLNRFIASEAGAVTVDWVVLTAALVGLGLAAMSVVSSGVEDTSGDIDGQLSSNEIIVTSFGPNYPSVGDLNYQKRAWNETAGPNIVAQHNCSGYDMSDGTAWEYCERKDQQGNNTYYWLSDEFGKIDGDEVPFS